MNDVIDQLAEIEAAALKISENTHTQKAAIAKEAEEKINDFDKNFQRKLDEKINALKSEQDKKNSHIIQQMQQDSIREIQKLEEEYSESHEQMAQDIVNRLTGV